jgi:OFA family oxalate/formate antiporter-like MFS transporter
MPTTDPLAFDVTRSRSRWLLVVAAILVQLALGGVYAWSVFNEPLQQQFGWSKAQAVLPFEVAIGSIVVGSLVGGRVQDRTGPRPVALAGGVLYAGGVMLASTVTRADQLWLLVLSNGVLGGIGLGAAYITPIAMLAKWFPDRRGLITGLAVGGFGFGAVLTAPVARRLLADAANKPDVFLPLGLAYLVAVIAGASLFRNPPKPPTASLTGPAADVHTLATALRTRQWYQLTAILMLNTLCGIALVSLASDALRQVAGLSAAAAATVVGLLGLFNGGGRIAWAAISDRIGRMNACVGMLTLQGVCFLLIPHATHPAAFIALAAVIYLCYGGAFGVMPATAADFFGTRNAGAIYGAMIVAWSAGGVLGPLLASQLYEQSGRSYTLPFTAIAVIALLAIVVPLTTRKPTRAA